MNLINTLKLVTISLLAGLVVACGGGTCTPNLIPTPTPSPTPSPTPDLSLVLTAPNQYPAGIPVTAYLTITNTSAYDASGLSYSIPAAGQTGNNTGVNITVDPNGAQQNCANIKSGASCTFTANIPAGSKPGSFTVTATTAASSSFMQKLHDNFGLKATTLTLTAYIGLTDLAPNDQSGANGITLLYPQSLPAYPSPQNTPVILVAVVNSATAGSFNTINLTAQNGTPLESVTVMSGNSGSGQPNLGQNSIVTFLAYIPANTSIYQVYPQTMLNGAVVSTASNSANIYLTGQGVGSLTALPYLFNITPAHPSQVITFTNPSATPISDLTINKLSDDPNLIIESAVGSNTCGATLAANASCIVTVTADTTEPIAQTNTLLVANYNNGQTYTNLDVPGTITGQPAAGGLLITSSMNPMNFVTNSITESISVTLTLKNTGTTAIEPTYSNTFSTQVYINAGYYPASYFSFSAGSCTIDSTAHPSDYYSVAISDTLQPGQTCTLIMTYGSNGQYAAPGIADLTAHYYYNSASPGDATTQPLPMNYQSTFSGIGVELHEGSPTGRLITNNVVGENEYFYAVLKLVNDTGNVPNQQISAATSQSGFNFLESDTCTLSSQQPTCSIGMYNGNSGNTVLNLVNSGVLNVSPPTTYLYVADYAYVSNITNDASSNYNATDVYKCLHNDDNGRLYPNCRPQAVAAQLGKTNFQPQKMTIIGQYISPDFYFVLYVIDTNNNQVDLCNINESGDLKSCVPTGTDSNNNPYTFTNPQAIATNSNNSVYISSTLNGVNGISYCDSVQQSPTDRRQLTNCQWLNPAGSTSVAGMAGLAYAGYSYDGGSQQQADLFYGVQNLSSASYLVNKLESTTSYQFEPNPMLAPSALLAWDSSQLQQFSALAVNILPSSDTSGLFYTTLNSTQVFACSLNTSFASSTAVGQVLGCGLTGNNFSKPDDIFIYGEFGYISNMTTGRDVSLCDYVAPGSAQQLPALNSCKPSGAGSFSASQAIILVPSLG